MTRGWFFWTLSTLLFLGLVAFAISPYEIGTRTEYRIIAYLKYWRVIEPSIVNPAALIERLESQDARLQIDAAQSIGFLDPDPRTTRALLQFIDRPRVEFEARDVAIWSLGELRAREALSVLRLRVGDGRYDAENLAGAIGKIERGGERPFLPE